MAFWLSLKNRADRDRWDRDNNAQRTKFGLGTQTTSKPGEPDEIVYIAPLKGKNEWIPVQLGMTFANDNPDEVGAEDNYWYVPKQQEAVNESGEEILIRAPDRLVFTQNTTPGDPYLDFTKANGSGTMLNWMGAAGSTPDARDVHIGAEFEGKGFQGLYPMPQQSGEHKRDAAGARLYDDGAGGETTTDTGTPILIP